MRRVGAAALWVLAIGGSLHAESCAELSTTAKALHTEVASIEAEMTTGDARLLECQGALSAAFTERREMKQVTDARRWQGAAHRLAISLQLISGTLDTRRLTRPQGDPQRPVDEAVDAAIADGVYSLAAGGAARLEAQMTAAQLRTRSPRIHAATVEAVRATLALIDDANAAGCSSNGALPELGAAEKLTRRFDQVDALFEDPALAGALPALRTRAASLDAALAGLAVAVERERRPAETLRDTLERKVQDLARVEARLAVCTDK